MTGKIKKIISIENGDNYVADIEDIENRITQNSSNLETAKQELSNKCDTVLSDAKAYTDTEKANLVKKSGDILTGEQFFRNVNNSSLHLMSGVGWSSGASLQLFGKDHELVPGGFRLDASSFINNDPTKVTFSRLQGTVDGTLTWDNKNIVRSVNDVNADTEGNVSISDVEEIGDGYIRLKSGLQICWGNTPGKDNSAAANPDSIEINLSKAFKNAEYKVICTDTGAACYVFGVRVSDTTRFTVYVQHWDGVGYWGANYIAIGMWK